MRPWGFLYYHSARWVEAVKIPVVNFQGELSERHSLASESGSSTDSHADTPDGKDGELTKLTADYCEVFMGAGEKKKKEEVWSIHLLPTTVKKKYGSALKFSNLMNIGKKKPSSQESPDKCVDTSGERDSWAHGKPDYDAIVLCRLRFCAASLFILHLLHISCTKEYMGKKIQSTPQFTVRVYNYAMETTTRSERNNWDVKELIQRWIIKCIFAVAGGTLNKQQHFRPEQAEMKNISYH